MLMDRPTYGLKDQRCPAPSVNAVGLLLPMPTLFLVNAFREELEMYAEFLSSSGFQVEAFGTPEAALRAAKRAAPDAIITRIRQDQGQMDGIQFTARLREEPATRHAAIVIITTSMLAHDREAAIQAGCDGYLLLPATPTDLVEKVQEVLSAKRKDRQED